ncbi:BZ3500_MvSof-1268-A1-R1_Chr2-2g04923 [Microbotryum saponariae]|uniref:BZ3500_MvSof-1268-A1-R1_Chr2-2g04923 protein n=1 Tax=Microbotryum saponariae TaxID=289078 RepID=A0A2X0L7G5_9BASI|nr:BZ3500_MvSof-1268-A1-R1_Chr2-2g04923 [Microbotryum saponariae]SDA00488.1 BZ3501_MvSof-1269-A2-R1_Chr2-2g04597 [Microbotryum saponariae]
MTIAHAHKLLDQELLTVPEALLGQHQDVRQALVSLVGAVDGESEATVAAGAMLHPPMNTLSLPLPPPTSHPPRFLVVRSGAEAAGIDLDPAGAAVVTVEACGALKGVLARQKGIQGTLMWEMSEDTVDFQLTQALRLGMGLRATG